MNDRKIEGFLTSNEIDRYSSEIRTFCSEIKFDSKETLRLKLSIEEVLLRWQNIFGNDQKIVLYMRTRLGKLHLELTTEAVSHNPFDRNFLNNDEAAVRRLMDNLTLSLKYQYQNGINKIVYDHKIKTGNHFFRSLITAMVAGIICGIIGKSLPSNLTATIMEFLNVVSTVIMGLVKMAAMPVIFLCTIKGITSTGSLAAFGSTGKRTIFGYLLTMCYILAFSIVVAMICFAEKGITLTMGTDGFSEIFRVFFSIFPDNIFSPFLNGDNLKILSIAILCGCALLFIGQNSDRLNDAINVLADTSTTIMSWVCKPMPVMVFIIMVQNIWDIEVFEECATLWKLILVILGMYVLAILVDLIIVAKKKRMKAGAIFKAILPAVLKGFATCTSMFCYPEMDSILTEDLKVKKEYVNFSLPLGLTFFQVDMFILACITIYFASLSGQPITPVWLLTLFVLCYLSSIAAPPVNGGLVAILAMIFTALGINEIYLGVASSLILLLDYPNTGGRVALIMLEIMRLSPEDDQSIQTTERETVK